MNLVDSHCHLEMIGDSRAAVAEARAAGVGQIVTIGIDLPSSRTAVELAGAEPGVYATVGLHPHEARRWTTRYLAELEALAGRPRVVAVGECGLDFYRDLSPRDAQRRAFIAQIELARRAGLPLVVHTREAADETMAHAGRGGRRPDRRHALLLAAASTWTSATSAATTRASPAT